MRLAPPPEEPEVPGQFWKDFIRETAPEFRKPTIVQLETFLQPTWQALIDGSMYVNDRLASIFDELAPDAIVEDNVVAFAAIRRAAVRGRGSCPATVRGEGRAGAAGFLRLADRGPASGRVLGGYDRVLGPQIAAFDAWLRRTAALAPQRARLHVGVAVPQHVPVPGGHGLPPRDPAAVDLAPARLERADRRAVRRGRGAARRAPVVYLSLGSLGSADVELMQRLIDVSARPTTASSSAKGRSTSC